MTCSPIYLRAGDAWDLTLTPVYVDDAGEERPWPLDGLEARAAFRDSARATLLTLAEGSGVTTDPAAGTITISATVAQTDPMAPPLGVSRHEINLAVRVYDPGDVQRTSKTIADLTLIVLESEVSNP